MERALLWRTNRARVSTLAVGENVKRLTFRSRTGQRLQQLVGEVTGRYRPLLHEFQMETLTGIVFTQGFLRAFAQREYLILADSISDRLRRPTCVPQNSAARRLAACPFRGCTQRCGI